MPLVNVSVCRPVPFPCDLQRHGLRDRAAGELQHRPAARLVSTLTCTGIDVLAAQVRLQRYAPAA